MPPRDAQGAQAPPRRPRRRGNSISAITQAVAHTVPAPAPGAQHRPVTPPQQSSVFGPLHSADAPIRQALHQATRNVQRAQQREPNPAPADSTGQATRPAPGTPFGKFQGNEPLAPILRARTQASADVARGSGWSGGTLGELARIGAHINPTPLDTPKKAPGLGLLATSFGPIGLAKSISHGDLAGAVAAINPAAPILKILHPTGTILQHSAQDAVDIPAEVVPSTYDVAKTAVHDPGKAAKMLAEPYIQTAKDPIGSFVAHPLQTYLLAEGVRGAIGRGAGRVMRTAPEGSLPQRLSSTERAPATLPGTSLEQTRRYSPDVSTRAVQVARDVRQTAKASRLRAQAQAASAAGDPETAQTLAEKANQVDPTRMNAGEIRRRMDERQDVNEQTRRMHRSKVTAQASEIVGNEKGAALSLATQRIAQPTVEDLRAYRDEIAAEYPSLKRATLQQANVKLRAQIDQALKNPSKLADVQQAADAYQQLVGPTSAKLGEIGVYAPEQVDMAPLVGYATRHMGARFNYAEGRLVAQDGEVLTPEAIRAHMAESGVGEPAFVTQAPHARNGYFVAQHEAPSVPKGTRTGEATLKGTFNADPETLVEGAARMQGLVDAHVGFGKMIDEFGLRGQHGDVQSFGNRQDAVKVADELTARGEGKWRPIRIQPFAGRSAQLHDLLERTSSEGQPEHESIRDAITAAIGKNADGAGPWAVVPDEAADQLAQHIRVLGSGGAGKAFQLGNSLFRRAVLATSPKWLTGNSVEAGVRAAVDRAGPRSWYTGHATQRVLAEAPTNRGVLGRAAGRAGDALFGPYQGRNPAAAEELAARAYGGGHYSMADKMPRRGYEQFQGTRLEPVANALHTFWSAPGPKQAADLWQHWTDFVFHKLNSPIEHQFQMAMGGAHIRRTLMDDAMVKTSKKAIDDAANGLMDTTAQVDLARAVDRAYGRYSKMSPTERRVVMLYTPFLAWSRNALTFVGRVLPRDHPVLTSALASAHAASSDWRKAHGLDLFASGSAPAFLQGSIPVSAGGKVRLSRYTPFGLFDDLPGTAGGQVLPQLSGALSGLQGQEWTGRPLPGIKNQPANPFPKAQAAGMALVEATVPLVGQIHQYMNAQGNPGQRLRKVYDPFAASRPKAKQSRSGRRGANTKVVFGGGSGGGPKVSFGSSTSGPKVSFGGG